MSNVSIFITHVGALQFCNSKHSKRQWPRRQHDQHQHFKVAAALNLDLIEDEYTQKQKHQHQLRLEYYAWLASKLAGEGSLAEFANLVYSKCNIMNLVEMDMVCKAFTRQIQNGNLYLVLESFRTLRTAGFHSPFFLDDNGRRLIANECQRLQKENLQECIQLLQILSDCDFPIKDLIEPKFIIKQCLQLKNVGLALRYASLLPLPHVWFSFLIRKFGKQGDLMSALIAFRSSQSAATTPDMYSYRDIIDACGLCGKPEQARIIFKELLSQKVTPNIFVYNSLMNANARDLEYVLQMYKHMKSSGVVADVTTYNILLKICCIAGKVDLAAHFYKEILSKTAAGNLKMDVITYSTIIQVFGKAKNWALAMEVKENMIASGIAPDVVTWTSLIGACANAGLVEKAIQVFDEMVLSGCEPNTQCCNTLLYACVESSQYGLAFQLFNSWMKNGFLKATERYKECVLETKMDISDAEKLHSENSSYPMLLYGPVVHNQVSKVPQFKPTVVTYNILMKACGSAPYFVKSLMEEMKILGLVPDRISWSNLIEAYGNTKDLRGVFQTLRKMHEADVKPDVIAYTTAIKACVKNKNPEKAFSIFDEMKKFVQPNEVTYNTLLTARRNYGNLAEVQQSLVIYEDMRRAGYAPNDNLLKALLEEWAEGVIQHNNCRNQDSLFKDAFIWKEKDDTKQLISYTELLRKVTAHAQPNSTINLIRVDGLTKTEARIVVLAVLRILREQHDIENPIKDDLTIITGVSNTQDSLHDAIVNVLQNELGLDVHAHRDALVSTSNDCSEGGLSEGIYHPTEKNYVSSYQDPSMHGKISNQSRELGIALRRPPELQSLRISRDSLNWWLGKKRSLKRAR